ncbi:MAG: class I SAM-dependent methyltransferase [Bacteroidia bacterium]|nr:class I SAM-dependent methyltransferase [Bacteroidia bacterium]
MPDLIKHNGLILTEEDFNSFLPDYLKRASRIFFTPVRMAQTASQWLVEDGRKTVLDIGAGVGKFCITGALQNNSLYCGIEYRKSLAQIGSRIITQNKIQNATVLYGDIIDVDFVNFDAFYLYNPFYENLLYASRLNNEVELKESFYDRYLKYTEDQLDKTKPGTRLVTYHGNNFEIPASFKKVRESGNRLLKLWIRQ